MPLDIIFMRDAAATLLFRARHYAMLYGYTALPRAMMLLRAAATRAC